MVVTYTPHVLVVEDDPAFRDLLLLRLRALGLEATAAGSVPAAIGVLEREHVDTVLSDHELPGATGLALLAYVRQALPLVPFVLMSANVERSLRSRALAGGAEAVYEKPDLLRALPRLFAGVPAAA